MIVFMDLPLYRRELIEESKLNCQRFNINVTTVDFLGIWEICR